MVWASCKPSPHYTNLFWDFTAWTGWYSSWKCWFYFVWITDYQKLLYHNHLMFKVANTFSIIFILFQCYPSDVTLSVDMQYFIKSHTLMHSSVEPSSRSPPYHFNNVFYDKLAVDFYSFEQVAYWIFYLPVNNSGQGEKKCWNELPKLSAVIIF